MADGEASDDGGGGGLASSFPHPPVYYKYFTKENVARLKEFEANGREEGEILKLLIPPPAPSTSYLNFGNIWQVHDKLPSLEEMGIKRLYNDNDGSNESGGMNRIEELRKLFKSLLVKYLQLVGVMSIDPEKFPPIVDEIRVLLINIHHLLNEYRPHQARQSLIIMMQEKLNSIKSSIDESSKTCTHVISRLTDIINLMDQIQSYHIESPQIIDEKKSSSSSTTTKSISLNDTLLQPVTVKQLELRDMESWNLLTQAGLV